MILRILSVTRKNCPVRKASLSARQWVNNLAQSSKLTCLYSEHLPAHADNEYAISHQIIYRDVVLTT